jgi:hypothetical protein
LLGFESGTVSLAELRRRQGGLGNDRLVDTKDAWVPSADRDRAKAALRQEWLRPELAKYRGRAKSVYWEFLGD